VTSPRYSGLRVTTFLYPAICINYLELLKLLAFKRAPLCSQYRSISMCRINLPAEKTIETISVRLARSVLTLFPNGGVESSNKHARSSETFEGFLEQKIGFGEGTKGDRNGKSGIYERP
jgi:hypothetical protein